MKFPVASPKRPGRPGVGWLSHWADMGHRHAAPKNLAPGSAIFRIFESMKALLILLTACICYGAVQSQPFRKYNIGNTGCTVHMYCDPKGFILDYSMDSSVVFTGECISNGVHYGVICIKLLQPISDPDAAEEVMLSYLDFLKADFRIKDSTGYARGHLLRDNPSTRGVLDYWKDIDDNGWKVKAWTNGVFIAVLYGHTKEVMSEQKMNAFLDSFRLPD